MGTGGEQKQPTPASQSPTASAALLPDTQPFPTKFFQDYGRSFLLAPGPLFVAEWWLPQALAQARAATGQQLPPPKRGAVLLDTGADKTCISLKVAQDLNLLPTRLQEGYGSGGNCVNPVYLATFELHIIDQKTQMATAISWEQEAAAVPKLHEHGMVRYADEDLELIGLLGRDFLRFCRFVYDGRRGTMEFEVDLAAMKIDPSR